MAVLTRRRVGRISGVSITTWSWQKEGKTYDSMLDGPLDEKEVARALAKAKAEPRREQNGVMGGLLIDGARTAVRRVLPRPQQWQEILNSRICPSNIPARCD
jgi:hypothetical protein